MHAPFRLYGSELSPYSVKVRAVLRFKELAFEWAPRSGARQEEFARYAKLPLIPVLVDAEDNAFQDSTPIVEALERAFPEPSMTPEAPALAFMSALIEDYADEWLNKAMFHYRWSYPEDQASASKRIVAMLFEGGEAPEGAEAAVRARMTGRLHHVGASPETAPIIEASFARLLALIEPMLGANPYLFGARPCLADFGLAGQLWTLASDPTPGAIITAQAPHVTAWLARMEAPKVEGGFASAASLRDALVGLLRQELGAAYLPWMAMNAAAVTDDAPGVSVEVAGGTFTQKPQRYAAKAFAELKRKRAAIEDATLTALLEDAGCAAYFTIGAEADESDEHEDDAGDGDAE
jgi:glutathione S-transferase